TMSDRIVLLRKGKIAQDGSPREIYEDPANLFVARFIGEINVFDATVIERKSDDELLANVEGRVCDIHTSISAEKGQKLQVLLRPEDIVIEELDENEHSNAIIGRIVDRTYKGMTLESTVEFDHNGKRVLVSEFFNEDDPHMDHSVGQRVGITWHEGWEVVLNDEDNQ
ncbi:MAG: TOBE domain-containing protein, partial [Haemophilus sp.]|nr:TOBE domain-containing protein [Haemophilus sp.]